MKKKEPRTLHGDLSPKSGGGKKHGAVGNHTPAKSNVPPSMKLGHLHPGAAGPKVPIPMEKAPAGRKAKQPSTAAPKAAGVAGGSPAIDKGRRKRQGGARG